MKSGFGRPPKARQYIEQLATAGRYSFTRHEAQAALAVSGSAAGLALNRLAKQGFIASPARGFYTIVPPEYRALGCLPAEQFVPDLMQRLKRRYYVALLSAAEFHGAAHQRPQALQVFLEGQRRPIVCGRVRVTFLVRKHLGEVSVQTVNTPRGVVVVSTPEATALDLVGYEQQAGGLNRVATVLSELAERIDAERLAAAANAAPIVWAQRLGHLLQQLGAADKTGPLQEHVGASAQKATPLAPGRPFRHSRRDTTWKVYVNADIEGDL
jgi:predicted transcriptional regulator of viral defense system